MAEQADGSRHPYGLGGATLVLLAAIASQRVQRPGAHARVLVIQREDQIGQRLLVDELIEEPHALAPDDGLWMVEAAAERRQRGRSRREQMEPCLLPTGRVAELTDPAVEVVRGRWAPHRIDRMSL